MFKKIIAVIITSILFVCVKIPVGTTEERPITTCSNTTSTETYKAERLLVRYDVPLDAELQNYIVELCKVYNLSPSLVFAVIEKESTYNAEAVNASESCFGLMQINECNFIAYEVDEPYNAFENVRAGIEILSDLFDKYGDINKVLIAYNCGEYRAKTLWSQGITSTSYSRSVLEIQKEINSKERIYYVEEN